MEWIKNKNIIKVLNDVGQSLHDDVMEMTDVDLFEDRLQFIRDSIENERPFGQRVSSEKFDKEKVYHTDIHTISLLVAQVVVFGRIVYKDKMGQLQFPKEELPHFMNMVECLPHHSTGKRIKEKINRVKRKIKRKK